MTLSCWSVRVVRAESCCAFELLSSFASAALESCKPETTAFSAFTSISRASLDSVARSSSACVRVVVCVSSCAAFSASVCAAASCSVNRLTTFCFSATAPFVSSSASVSSATFLLSLSPVVSLSSLRTDAFKASTSLRARSSADWAASRCVVSVATLALSVLASPAAASARSERAAPSALRVASSSCFVSRSAVMVVPLSF
mmetsp:Transcript_50094/g.95693  ORF Transcript_50094/g.95693 Transcript_50094/m.95693 type:complete len:201 (-) Transcript_50094:770-1372(-)